MQGLARTAAESVPHRHLDGGDRHHGGAFVVIVAGAKHMTMKALDACDVVADRKGRHEPAKDCRYGIDQRDGLTPSDDACIGLDANDQAGRPGATPRAPQDGFLERHPHEPVIEFG